MFWLLGTGSNHGNTKTAKHTGGKERLGREEGETGTAKERLASLSKLQANLYLLQITLICG